MNYYKNNILDLSNKENIETKEFNIYINSHSIDKLLSRNLLSKNINIKEKHNQINKLFINDIEILECLETRPSGYNIPKLVMKINDIYIPIRIFYKNYIYNIKVLSFLTSKQFKLSCNLNYGIYKNKFIIKKENIRNIFIDKETNFDSITDILNYDFNPQNYNWNHKIIKTNKLDSKPIFEIKNNHNNFIMEEINLPFYVNINNNYYKIKN